MAVLDANLCKSIFGKIADLRTNYYKPSLSEYPISLLINLSSVILKLGQGPGLKRNELIAKQSVFSLFKTF